MTRKNAERHEAIERLRGWVRPGDTVYTILRHVSRSGMQREIGVVIPQVDCLAGTASFLHPNHAVATVLGERMGKRDGVIVSGGGMDMGFHVVYNLGCVLWPKGFGCAGEKCRSNDHSNGDRNRAPDTFEHEADVRDVAYIERGERVRYDVRGVWGERDTWGKRELTRGDQPPLYLFDDEIVSDEGADRHWHQDGGYALRHEWL